jgi:hypothetical protein
MTNLRSGKFVGVPADDDTEILFEREIHVFDKDGLLQIWSWDDLRGASIILITNEISSIEDTDLIKNLKDSEVLTHDTETIIKRGEKYTFINWVPGEGVKNEA